MLQSEIDPNLPLLGDVQIAQDPNLTDSLKLKPIDFILLGLSSQPLENEKRLEAAKMLLCNGAELNGSDLLNGINLLCEQFLTEILPKTNDKVCERLEKLAKERSSNLFLRKIALLAKNPRGNPLLSQNVELWNLIKNLVEFNQHLPELIAEKQRIINANTLAIRAARPEEQNPLFGPPLIHLISGFRYS